MVEANNGIINVPLITSDAEVAAAFPNSFVANAANELEFSGSDPLVLEDWRLLIGSQYRAGGARDASDGTDVGVDIDDLTTALPGGGNLAPIVNAGTDQSLGSGTSSTTLTATALDPESDAMTYLWTRISGPNTPTIVSATSLSTSVTGMIAGTYVFRFQATDTADNVDTDDVQIIIAANGGGGGDVIVRANLGMTVI